MLCWKPSVWPTSCATTYSMQAAHQVVGQRQLLRARIERADLHEVPVARQVHDVVVELDVRLEDLAACADRERAGPTAFSVVDGSQRITE